MYVVFGNSVGELDRNEKKNVIFLMISLSDLQVFLDICDL